ncbi:MAG: arginase family protein [Haliscomenobacter sp.]|nr:arginase family protein [Haliscomenobacter sp.]
MLENWLSPVPLGDIVEEPLATWHLGSHLRIYTEAGLPSLKGVRIALVGIGEKDANAARTALYSLSYPFEGLKIADLGNIRKNNLSFIIPALAELMEARILPVLIGNDPYFGLSLYKAAQQVLKHISLVVADERIRFRPQAKEARDHLLNELILNEESQLFHLGVIGYQTHYTPPEVLREMERRNFDIVRLGFAKTNFSEVEPIVRDGDLCFVNLSVLKEADAPGQSSPSPSGFILEEACQVCRYAGMSDKLKAFGLFGFRSSMDRKTQTAQAVAQMIWYFLDGFHHRKGDFPASVEGLVEYVVDLKQLDYQLTFWKSQKTGRWWIQVPVKTARKHQRHRLIPCSYNDYKQACQDELPERLIAAFKRFI